jgi:Zn-finger nucleic acid-binding protein
MVAMAICPDCKQSMTTAISCNHPFIKLKGKWYKRNTSYYDLGRAGQGRCHDCGIKNHGGHIHHFGCDIERCPRCKGQLISCGCADRTTRVSLLPNDNVPVQKPAGRYITASTLKAVIKRDWGKSKPKKSVGSGLQHTWSEADLTRGMPN